MRLEFFLSLILFSSSAFAGSSLIYEGRFSPKTPSMNEDKLKFSTPLYQAEKDSVSANLTAGRVHLGAPVDLGTGIVVPTDLYRLDLGAQFTHQLPEFRNWGLRGNFGYSGDKIFQNLGDNEFNLSAQYGFPTSRESFWILTVFISNSGVFGTFLPLPGVLYVYKTEHFTGTFGFPIASMQWTPEKDVVYSFSALGPSFTAEAAQGLIEKAQYFVNFNWTNQRFMASNRQNFQDRLTLEEKKGSLGVRMPLAGFLQGEIQGGYAFDRLFYIGKGFRNMAEGSAQIDPDWFISLSLKAGL